MRWEDDAACRGMDPDVFFPVSRSLAAARQAKRICRECPVRVDCLRYALDHQTSRDGTDRGVWAGLTTDERLTLKRRLRRTA